MWIPCACRVRQNKHMEGRKHRITPCPPPPKSLLSPALFVCLWVCEWEKQCYPTEPGHYSNGGSEKGCLKRGGLDGIQACVAFSSSSNNVWEDPVGHRHAIPSPIDISIHQPDRRNADGQGGWGERDWTEELFRLRRDTYGERALWRRCATDLTIQTHVISQTQTQWYHLYSQVRAGRETNISPAFV